MVDFLPAHIGVSRGAQPISSCFCPRWGERTVLGAPSPAVLWWRVQVLYRCSQLLHSLGLAWCCDSPCMGDDPQILVCSRERSCSGILHQSHTFCGLLEESPAKIRWLRSSNGLFMVFLKKLRGGNVQGDILRYQQLKKSILEKGVVLGGKKKEF